MHSIANFARNFAQRKNAQHSKFRNEFRETPVCPNLFLTSAQRPQCPQCPTIAQRSQDATGEGGAMANGDRSRQRASQRSALTMQIHDAPACHNRNTTFAPPCMGPPRDSQFCGIERGRFRRMPDGDYSARRATSPRTSRICAAYGVMAAGARWLKYIVKSPYFA